MTINAPTKNILDLGLPVTPDSSLDPLIYRELSVIYQALRNLHNSIIPQYSAAPPYVKGMVYFDTTLNKLRVGGVAAWETITSI